MAAKNILARHAIRQSPQYQRTENGDEADNPDAEGTCHGVETMVHQHWHAVGAQQIHAETAGKQAESNLQEWRSAYWPH